MNHTPEESLDSLIETSIGQVPIATIKVAYAVRDANGAEYIVILFDAGGWATAPSTAKWLLAKFGKLQSLNSSTFDLPLHSSIDDVDAVIALWTVSSDIPLYMLVGRKVSFHRQENEREWIGRWQTARPSPGVITVVVEKDEHGTRDFYTWCPELLRGSLGKKWKLD